MALPPSSSSREPTKADAEYCHEVARRSVARASLALGIDRMSDECLDMLGRVLLEYLSSMGKATAEAVEQSGRSSSHTHVLDILEAAAPAGGYSDLADFCFGKESLVATTTTAATATTGGATNQWQSNPSGTAIGPVGAMMNGTSNKSNDKTLQAEDRGWDAPHIDEVPIFPLRAQYTTLTAPTEEAAATGDGKKTEAAASPPEDVILKSIPDSAYYWGCIRDEKKEEKKVTIEEEKKNGTPDKSAADTTTSTTEKPAKKPRILDRPQRPAYVPSFLPPPPPAVPKEGLVVTSAQLMKSAAAGLVRRPTTDQDGGGKGASSSSFKASLVGYWGTHQHAPAAEPLPKSEETQEPSSSSLSLKVPEGRSDAPTSSKTTPAVVPLGRASGSRVSRILEGSMDAAIS